MKGDTNFSHTIACTTTLFLKRNATFESCNFLGEDCIKISGHVVNFCFGNTPGYVHDPELLTLTQGHQGKWNKKSCVSFEEECRPYQ